MKLSERLALGELIRVGVFLGGFSSEREISLESGRHIYNNLDLNKYEITPIFISREMDMYIIEEGMLWLNTTDDIKRECDEKSIKPLKYQDLPQIIDFAFLGVHGKMVEDGTLQGLFELINLPYNGPGILGSAVGMDKLFQRYILKSYNFNVPKYLPVYNKDWNDNKDLIIKQLEEQIGYPIVTKPSREGCSTAVCKSSNSSDLKKALDEALIWDNIAIAEEFVDGQEITCTIIGNDDPVALVPTETPKKKDILSVEEKFLPGDASMITPPTGMDENTVKYVQSEFVRAYKVLNLSVYSRIDAFWKNGKLIILEPNTLPGVTPSTMVFHQAAEAGMNSMEFFDRIIKLSIDAFERKIGPR